MIMRKTIHILKEIGICVMSLCSIVVFFAEVFRWMMYV